MGGLDTAASVVVVKAKRHEQQLGFSGARLLLRWLTGLCCVWGALQARGDAIAPQGCDAQTSKPCSAVVGYMAPANFQLAHVASSLFSLNFTSLLGPNDIDLSLPNLSQLVVPPRQKPYLIPQTCGCLGDTRVVTSINYTVVAGDTLSAIASQYLNLVTYMEIANVSNIPNPDLIQIGQELVIPIPCSCFNNQSNALSLSYQIQDGDSLSKIAQLYSTSTARLQELNVQANASDQLELEPAQVLFVPLSVCKANFSAGAMDANLTVVESAYELTADGCVQCICNNGTLHCIPTPSSLGSNCSNFTCSNSSLVLGVSNTSLQASGECLVESCVYKGFTAQREIIASLEVEKVHTCPGAPPPESFYKPPTGLVTAPIEGPPAVSSTSSPLPTPSPLSTPSTPSTPLATTPSNSAMPLLVGGMSLSTWWSWYLLIIPML